VVTVEGHVEDNVDFVGESSQRNVIHVSYIKIKSKLSPFSV